MTGGTMSTRHETDRALTVGQVAEELGVTVRTLHHYDAIRLLIPSERTPSGYRLYTGEDITRLQHVVVYR
ncbi:MAG: MerR family transcriptional regulator, partial [Lapillicoccus sp.]